jgi:hypothetical protein
LVHNVSPHSAEKVLTPLQADALAFQSGWRHVWIGARNVFIIGQQQPAWGRSREFEITTRSKGRNGMLQSTTGDLEDEEEDDLDKTLVHGREKRKVAFIPSLGAQ